MLLALLLACAPEVPPPAPPKPMAPAAPTVDRARLSVFGPLPAAMTADGQPAAAALVDLGRALYYDPRLSKNQDVSCNTCHLLDKYGVDGTPTSTGHKAQKGGRNAPTTYHAAGHLAQFWDGRAADVEAQAKGPVLNPIEMAMPSAAAVEGVLRSIPGYAALFAAAFPGQTQAITYDNMAVAIGAFERGLLTPAPWDRFLAGDDKALSPAQQEGLNVFLNSGCGSCHNGPYLGGAMFQKVGIVAPWPNLADEGRFAVTASEADRMMFKVPSLRNIAKTGPYFHDGSVADLNTAVVMMGKHQLGKALGPAEAGAIVTFLDALTGELPLAYIAPPTLPEKGPKTPAADPG